MPMTNAAARLRVVPTGAALGADIEGVDVSQPIDAETFDLILKAWGEHLVLRFRGQNLDDDDLARFSARFGDLDDAPTRAQDSQYALSRKDIAIISNIVADDGKPIGGLGNSELVWHQDMSYKDLPPKASLLYGIEVPEVGGATAFYNLYKAYETLPENLRKRIEGRSCKHDATRNSAGQLRSGLQESYTNEERPGAIHPLVVRHPMTGRPSLYLGRRPNAWIVGLSDDESDTLLDELWGHIENNDFAWAQEWRPGDLVLWDNRCTLHRRGPLDPALRRRMHRTQVRDEARPVAAA
jgi:taurine dioxygenase